jgi:hypothetical protein
MVMLCRCHIIISSWLPLLGWGRVQVSAGEFVVEEGVGRGLTGNSQEVHTKPPGLYQWHRRTRLLAAICMIEVLSGGRKMGGMGRPGSGSGGQDEAGGGENDTLQRRVVEREEVRFHTTSDRIPLVSFIVPLNWSSAARLITWARGQCREKIV